MRLSDVKWEEVPDAMGGQLRRAWVLDQNNTKITLYHYRHKPTVNAWSRRDIDGKNYSLLELACWLADKEPCEPTSSSASSSTS